jgi:hypothetical protein
MLVTQSDRTLLCSRQQKGDRTLHRKCDHLFTEQKVLPGQALTSIYSSRQGD